MATAPVTALGQDQFLTLLTAQLQNQDPLNPVSSQEFVAQLASLSTVQGLQNLNASFAEMLKLQQLTQGTDLIGRTVEYAPADGQAAATGVVDSVAVRDGAFVLNIGSTAIGLDQIVTVKS